ncbi:MAG: prenyltransferase, partial [Dehalococcoidia bacterium]|nr:prenyltransferase [Dehalococcoidia bacterium]
LIIALCQIGEEKRAGALLYWTLRLADSEPGYCRGIKLPEQEPCPPERATWTSAALIMAVAALCRVQGEE